MEDGDGNAAPAFRLGVADRGLGLKIGKPGPHAHIKVIASSMLARARLPDAGKSGKDFSCRLFTVAG
jgi:hypothetical protein